MKINICHYEIVEQSITMRKLRLMKQKDQY